MAGAPRQGRGELRAQPPLGRRCPRHPSPPTPTPQHVLPRRNPLLYRINRIEKLTGLDLDRHAHRELARLAVVWRDTTGGDTLDRPE
ncbi:helix-turn-helix domain-containing protein [Streptomyces sp. NPDC008092]|uniref:helix-turn-helix domain-containing protein n=1 Tax=Streptomyces sp. NPDC008092 TaxID=3364808 RepID=UPI0036ED929B